jgi:hypothetical protein
MTGDDADPVRRAARYRVDRDTEQDLTEPGTKDGADGEAVEAAPRPRMDDRALWVDTVVDQAIRRGEFDDLPGQGKPLRGIGGTHDPDWWLKNLVEREQISGVLPAAQLRRDDAELDETLDREVDEASVRRVVEEFNYQVIDARRQLLGGPPVVTKTRDAETEVRRWRERRRARGIRG